MPLVSSKRRASLHGLFTVARARWARFVLLVALTVFSLLACSPPPPAVAPPPPETVVSVPAAVPEKPASAPEPESSTIVPVAASDVVWGEALAPVTWVIWGDYEDPFARRLFSHVEGLMKAYGPEKLRVVWRHKPLPWHPQAETYAVAAETVLRLGGGEAFWRFSRALMENQRAISTDDLPRLAGEAGVDEAAFGEALAANEHAAKVREDQVLWKTLGLTGAPASLINGVFVAGAPGEEKLAEVIDAELAATRDMVASGVPRERVYAASVEKNYKKPEPKLAGAPPPDVGDGAAAGTAGGAASAPAGGRFGAKHLVVMYQGSKSAPAHVTRTKSQALARAKEARKKALGGAKFEDLVSEYSDEPGAAGRGGDLGTFKRGMMVQPFEDGVAKTKVGAISEVVETAFGYHVILRTR